MTDVPYSKPTVREYAEDAFDIAAKVEKSARIVGSTVPDSTAKLLSELAGAVQKLAQGLNQCSGSSESLK